MDEKIIDQLIPKDQLAAFGKLFLTEYLKDGFGMQSKRSIDLYVFYLLEQLGTLGKLDQNTVSETLRVTESRVTSFRYESRLRFANVSDEDFKKHVLWMLARSDFDTESLKVKFIIEDTFMRKRLNAISKRIGGVPDSSFNAEIVSLHYEQLSFLIKWLFGEEISEEYNNQFQKLIAENSKVKFSDVRKAIVLGAAKQLGGGVVKLAKSWLTGDPT